MPPKCEKSSYILVSNCLYSVANAFHEYLVNIRPMVNRGRNNSMDSSADIGQKHLFIYSFKMYG